MSISYIIARTNYIFYEMIIDFLIVLDQHTALDFYCAISLKQQSVDINVPPLWHINLITRQLVFALGSQRSNKYQFNSLWFNLSDARTTIYHSRGEHANHFVFALSCHLV